MEQLFHGIISLILGIELIILIELFFTKVRNRFEKIEKRIEKIEKESKSNK